MINTFNNDSEPTPLAADTKQWIFIGTSNTISGGKAYDVYPICMNFRLLLDVPGGLAQDNIDYVILTIRGVSSSEGRKADIKIPVYARRKQIVRPNIISVERLAIYPECPESFVLY